MKLLGKSLKEVYHMQVYADNAATTKMSRVAIDAMLPYFDNIYANPSSLHSHVAYFALLTRTLVACRIRGTRSVSRRAANMFVLASA